MRLQNPHRVVKSVGHRATMFLEAVPGCSTQDQSILENKATKQSQTQYWFPPQSCLTTFIRYWMELKMASSKKGYDFLLVSDLKLKIDN